MVFRGGGHGVGKGAWVITYGLIDRSLVTCYKMGGGDGSFTL